MTCPAVESYFFQCPSISKRPLSLLSRELFSGELFIGVNFTAIALENDRPFGKDPFVSIQLGYGIINQLESAFPLFSNVQLQATLAVIRRETLTNTKLAALGFQKVGCDAQKIYQRR